MVTDNQLNKDLEKGITGLLRKSEEIKEEAHKQYVSFIRNCFLIHSGATIAILGIISALISTNNHALALGVTADIKYFIIGVVYTTLIHLLGSTMLYKIHDDVKAANKHVKEGKHKEAAKRIEVLSIVKKVSNNIPLSFLGMSIPLILFVVGCCQVNSTFVEHLSK